MIFIIFEFSSFLTPEKSCQKILCQRFHPSGNEFDLNIVFLVELDKTPPSKIIRNRFSALISKNQLDFGASVSGDRKFTQIQGPAWLEIELVLGDESRKSNSDNFARWSFI